MRERERGGERETVSKHLSTLGASVAFYTSAAEENVLNAKELLKGS